MRIIFIILVLFFVAIVQTTFVPKIAIYGVFPNLILLVIIFKSAFKDYRKVFIWSLTGGIILDIFSGGIPFGVFTLSFLIISLLVSFLSRNIWSSEFIGLVLLLLTFLGSFISGFTTVLFTKLGFLIMGVSWGAYLGHLSVIVFSESVYNLILMAIFLLVLKKTQLFNRIYVRR